MREIKDGRRVAYIRPLEYGEAANEVYELEKKN